VYLKTTAPNAGDYAPALATSLETARVIGLASQAANAGDFIPAYTDSLFSMGGEGWDAVTGGSGGLTPGAVYYLSATTAGRITTTPPTGDGEYVVRIGRALEATVMEVKIEPPIKL
jgi:hypothetical protein